MPEPAHPVAISMENLTEAIYQEELPVRRNWMGVALLAASPLLLLQVIFQIDPFTSAGGGAYMLFMLVVVIVIIAWVIGLIVEFRWRGRFASWSGRTAWFSLAGVPALVLLLFAGELARPVVLRVPRWCGIGQIAEWDTSAKAAKYGAPARFILVYRGRGNREHPNFLSAYLNWSGEGEGIAGFSGITLHPLSFKHWENEKEVDVTTVGSELNLRSRLQNSGLPEAEVQSLASALWASLLEASQNNRIIAPGGKVGDLGVSPHDHEDTVLGGILWSMALVLVFGLIAWFASGEAVIKPGGVQPA